MEKQYGIGYKVLYMNRMGNTYAPFKKTRFPKDVWIDDERSKGRKLSYDNVMRSYTPGFHLFQTIDDAHAFSLRYPSTNGRPIFKVRYRNVVAGGTQNKISVIVARSIKVLNKVK
jgi:hypothetical protein